MTVREIAVRSGGREGTLEGNRRALHTLLYSFDSFIHCVNFLPQQKMFLVLEYCEGGELQDLFKEKGHFAEDVSNSFVHYSFSR